MNIGDMLQRILQKRKPARPPRPATAKEHVDTKIKGLPLSGDPAAINVEQCFRCIENIPGILHPLEGFALYLLSMSSPGDDPIVEVGSYLGRSTSYIALGSIMSRKKGVCAVDMFPRASDWYRGTDGHYHIHGSDYYLDEHIYHERAAFFYGDSAYGSTLDIFKDIMKKTGLEGAVEPFRGTSIQYARQQNVQLRMVFIDGDHTYDGVRKDILALADRVVDNGSMCFHDYSVHFPGVVKAVDEFVVNSEGFGDIFRVKDLLVARKRPRTEGR